MSTDEDQLKSYAVRPSDLVADQIGAEYERLEQLFGRGAANAWEDGLMDAIASLATLPGRCATAQENDVFQRVRAHQTLRVLKYKQTPKGFEWRILFSIQEDQKDAPTVRIQYLRHSTQAPMTDWPAEDE